MAGRARGRPGLGGPLVPRPQASPPRRWRATAAILRLPGGARVPAAERCAADEPVSVLDGRSLPRTTEWADPVPRQQRRDGSARRAASACSSAALLGRLHHAKGRQPAASAGTALALVAGRSRGRAVPGITLPTGCRRRRSRPLAGCSPRLRLSFPTPSVRHSTRSGRGRRAGRGGGTCTEGLRHPDFCVLANVVMRRRAGMVLVDWAGACGAVAAPVVAGVPPVRGGREGAAPGGCPCCSATASTSRWKRRRTRPPQGAVARTRPLILRRGEHVPPTGHPAARKIDTGRPAPAPTPLSWTAPTA